MEYEEIVKHILYTTRSLNEFISDDMPTNEELHNALSNAIEELKALQHKIKVDSWYNKED